MAEHAAAAVPPAATQAAPVGDEIATVVVPAERTATGVALVPPVVVMVAVTEAAGEVVVHGLEEVMVHAHDVLSIYRE
jgi:hypothetical protein